MRRRRSLSFRPEIPGEAYREAAVPAGSAMIEQAQESRPTAQVRIASGRALVGRIAPNMHRAGTVVGIDRLHHDGLKRPGKSGHGEA